MVTIRFRLLQILSLTLVFLTGGTALVFQNTWHRYLTYLLGSQSQATAMILACFLGGMATGYFLYGHLAGRFSGKLFRLYGATECAIGIWALLSPTLFEILREFPLGGFFSELLVTLLFIGLPTVLMGGTIPILTQALSENLDNATRIHSRVYGLNTFGAALGSILAGLYFLPLFGLPMTLFAAGAVNLAVGLIFYLLDPFFNNQKTALPEAPAVSGEVKKEAIQWLWLIAFFAGFITIGLETLMIRLMALTLGSSAYTFSIVVAIFIFCIAFGGFLVGHLKPIPSYSIWLVLLLQTMCLTVLYQTVELWPFVAQYVRALFSSIPEAFWPYQAVVALLMALILLIPISLGGAMLPLCFHFIKEQSDSLGSRAGRLYAINTLGCVLGALLCGYYLLFLLDLNQVFQLLIYLTLFSNGVALVVSLRLNILNRKWLLAAATGLAAGYLFIQPLWDHVYFTSGWFRQRNLTANTIDKYRAISKTLDYLYYRDGPMATVAVRKLVESGTKTSLSIFVNGKSDGNTLNDFYTMQLLGHLAILLSAHPQNVAVIGYGTGMSAGAAAQYREVKKIDLIEINPMVLEGGKLFDPFNYGVLSHPKIQTHLTDAFRFFRTQAIRYDAIINEPSNPWTQGVENLFTLDYFQLVKEHLSETGVFVHWLQGYEFSNTSFRLVLNTFQAAFPYYHLFQIHEGDYALIGSLQPIDGSRLKIMQTRFHKEQNNRAIRELDFSDPANFLALERINQVQWDTYMAHGGLQTLENPKLAYWAGQELFADGWVNLAPIMKIKYKKNSTPFLRNIYWQDNPDPSPLVFPEHFCEHSPKLCNQLHREGLHQPETPPTG